MMIDLTGFTPPNSFPVRFPILFSILC
jgi:hypothetical protein